MGAKRDSEAGALDLVPIMNLVTILIPFLLMSTHFATVATLRADVPSTTPMDEAEPDRLSLRILITADGYEVATDGQVIGANGEQSVEVGDDLSALNALLADIKGDWPDEGMVVLVPDENTSYDRIIQVMDASRSAGDLDLFPNVIIAGGK